MARICKTIVKKIDNLVRPWQADTGKSGKFKNNVCFRKKRF